MKPSELIQAQNLANCQALETLEHIADTFPDLPREVLERIERRATALTNAATAYEEFYEPDDQDSYAGDEEEQAKDALIDAGHALGEARRALVRAAAARAAKKGYCEAFVSKAYRLAEIIRSVDGLTG